MGALFGFALLFSFMIFTSGAKAYAGQVSCSGWGACISTTVSMGASGNTGGGGQGSGGGNGGSGGSGSGNGGSGGTGGNGGSVSPPKFDVVCSPSQKNAEGAPVGYQTSYSPVCLPEFKMSHTVIQNYVAGCGVKTVNGVPLKAMGTIVVIKSKLDMVTYDTVGEGKLAYAYAYVQSSKNEYCIYPEVTTTKSVTSCVLKSNYKLDRLANSRLGAARIASGSKSYTTVAAMKKGLTKDCKQSETLSYNKSLPNNEKNWGQYTLNAQITMATCQSGVTTTFDGQSKTQYANCNQRTVTGNGSMTLWCGGAQPGLANKNWTVNQCLNTASSWQYTCKVPTPTYDGKSGTIQSLRDGKSRTLNWGTPKPGKNVVSTSNWRQKIDVVNNSTPYNTSVGSNDKAQQYFWSNRAFGSWINKGSIGANNSQGLAFYNASNPNGSWGAKRSLLFDGKFRMKVSQFQSLKVYASGAVNMNTSTKTVTVTDKNIKCNQATSPRVQAIRTIGDAH